MKQPNHLLKALVVVLPASFLPLAAFAASSSDPTRVDAMALYNRGAAVVQTTRDIDLKSGDQTIGWPISGRLRADTVWLEGEGVRLTGLTARAGDDSGQGLLAGRVGQPVTLLRDNDAGDARSREATLVGVNGDTLLVRVDDRIERLTGDSPWRVAWPAGDDSGDGLQLDIDADKAGKQPLTATYQIDGPSWQASYTGRFDAQAGQLELASMAIIDNSAGARLAAEKAWLVAGDVARTNGHAPTPMMMARFEAKASDAGAPEANGDTYRYALEDGIDVAAGGTRAVSIMAPKTFDATRSYRVENSFYSVSREGQRSHAQIRLAFDNTAEVPLPAGAVRIYDSSGSANLMGEDRIDDTPKQAPVTLTLGTAFDLTSERRLVEDRKTGENERRRTVEITLHNASADAATVQVVENLPQGATVESAEPKTADDAPANTAEWQIDVPANGEQTLRYTAVWSN
ncbi:hypothetical protein SSPSH_000819 [Salinisphaera shabanensis E1L3A]|uniref:DUF4139 domain-containing protein n=1 Tax=Salinisphaera shabanensis E1L3A TaxID=1033802 RepID=U2ER74_9GAMM|nr:DUF4139 domain-containing protein [Salinisphaera shabanensis]ERJ20260.1 hypothetical protein SSPSH_000819 [Salinisphaera shabanensis E1L3A]